MSGITSKKNFSPSFSEEAATYVPGCARMEAGSAGACAKADPFGLCGHRSFTYATKRCRTTALGSNRSTRARRGFEKPLSCLPKHFKNRRMCRPLAASSTQVPQPPFALETAEESLSSQDGVHDVGVTGMDQGPCALRSRPTMPFRKLLNKARVEASPHGCRAMPPGVGQEPLQHAVERAVPGRNLENFANPARVHVVEVPSDRLLFSVENGTRAQCSMACLAGRLLEQPGERASVVHRVQGVAVQNLGQMGQHNGRIPMEPVRVQPGGQRVGQGAHRARRA